MNRFFTVTVLMLCAGAQARELTIRTFLSHDKLAPGEAFRIAVVVELAHPWHINAHSVNDPTLIPTVITWRAPATVKIERTLYPPGKTVKLAWSDKPVSLYEGRVVFLAEGRTAKNAPQGPLRIEGSLRYQACDNETCVAPQSVPVVVETVVGNGPRPVHPEIFSAVPATAAGEDNPIASLIRQHGWWPALFFVFIGGLALNLTPCVYPMITITVSYFGGVGGQRTLARAFGASLVYCSGIVITYSTLGLLAALTGSLFGALLQHPVVLVVIALLLVALALSLFGLYEIQPPRFLLERATGLSSKAGYVGIFFLGAMIGIIAAPCLAPFVVALLTFVAQRANPWLGWWLFFVFACGLGLPYVVLGTFSGLLSRLPKSGMWMVWVKRLFGVGLLAVAVWITNPLWSRTDPLDPAKIAAQLAEARAQRKPVLLDFYATWCAPCKEMDKLTFPDPRVQERLRNFVLVKVNLSRSGAPAVEQLAQQYQVRGVPTFVFLDAEGRERTDLRAVGFIPPEEFVKRLDRALSPPPPQSVPSSPAPDVPPTLLKRF